MTADQTPAADAWGIHQTWIDAHDEPCEVSAQDVARLREVIGQPPADLDDRAPMVTRPGAELGIGAIEVSCEDGSTRTINNNVPDDFPLGYHRFRDASGNDRHLIVSPGKCWLPDNWRAWGLTIQLYAARSRQSWGIGDLADLRAIREWSQGKGAEFVLVNPLHAVAPTFPQEASPYLPTTRRFRNPLYLRVEEVPGFDRIDGAALTSAGRALNDDGLIDRDASWQLKRDALRQIFASTRSAADAEARADQEFRQWRSGQGAALQDFATWSAIALEHGSDWHDWPAELQNPSGKAVEAFARDHQHEVDFQAWLQWLLDGQLKAASGDVQVLQDLPIGVDGGGADAWVWQDVLAQGVTVGAPPDLLSSAGQNWGSPPMVPWRLRESNYVPFIESIRATMANAGGLRIDHVMGLFRLWWVPADGVPAHGAYVRYPSADLLNIVALESHRQRAIVVGEDLGTVEDGVRETLADHNLLSYRLLWFEEEEPVEWPAKAMAAITTHDLPTIAGLWSGADLDDQRAHTDESEEELEAQRTSLLAPLSASDRLSSDSTDEEVVIEAHRLLAQAPAILLSATLDDALAVRLRPNMPGTADRANWKLPLPVPIEELTGHTTANSVADLLNESLR